MSSRLRALGAFAALTVTLGIVAHLAAELAGLGWHDDGPLIASPRHAYLLALALGGVAALWMLVVRSSRSRNRRAMTLELANELPFHGRGLPFFVLSFACQFGFFAVSQIGEGCPLCGGDVLVGIAAALLAACIGALALACVQRVMVALGLALAWFRPQAAADDARAAMPAPRAQSARRRRSLLMYRANRPPPTQLAFD